MKYLMFIALMASFNLSLAKEPDRDWNAAKKAAEDAYFSESLDIRWEMVSDKEELEKTWRTARIYLPEGITGPGGWTLDKIEGEGPGVLKSKFPLVLYMHSCTGFAFHREDMMNLSRLGFAVIAPDSFARSYRPMGCFEDGEVLTKYADLVTAFQKAELDYAVRKLAELPWIDQENIFLMGSGMLGGMVVAQYPGKEFKGHLIEGWGCNSPIPYQSGIWSPDSVRIFAVVSSGDPWYREHKAVGYSGDCGEFIQNRPRSRSIVLDCPCHYGSWYPEARPALIEFLMKDLRVDYAHFLDDEPEIIFANGVDVKLKRKWSISAVYEAARKYCAKLGLNGHLTGPGRNEIYPFQCG